MTTKLVTVYIMVCACDDERYGNNKKVEVMMFDASRRSFTHVIRFCGYFPFSRAHGPHSTLPDFSLILQLLSPFTRLHFLCVWLQLCSKVKNLNPGYPDWWKTKCFLAWNELDIKQNSPQPNFHWGIGVDEATKTFSLKWARQQKKTHLQPNINTEHFYWALLQVESNL